MSTALAGARPRPGIAGWTLIVVRSLALVVWLLLMLPVFAPFKVFTPRNPVPRLFFIGVNHILGLRIAVSGSRLKRGVFLISNHVSWLDIPALGAVTGTAFIANDGLLAHGWLHWLCRLNDTVFVARHDRASVRRQVEQVREAIGENGALTIFAEGGTSDGSAILPFKSSLLSALTPVPAGVSVHPVLLDYGRETGSIAWVGNEHGGHSYLKIAARWRPVRLTVHLLPALPEADLADRKRIAAAAYGALADLKSRRSQRVAL